MTPTSILAMTETPRGLRNNNPGNIRISKIHWIGEADAQPDPDFVTFSAPEYGIRAVCKILLSYQADDRCQTIRQLISRWAPPNENDTGAYVDAVSRACGLGPDEPANVHTVAVMRPLVEAIIRQENGEQPYPPELILDGLRIAGIGPLLRRMDNDPEPSPEQAPEQISQDPPAPPEDDRIRV